MLRRPLTGGLLAWLAVAGPVHAVEVEDFALLTVQDLVDVCSVEAGAPLAAEAEQACYGYIAGTIHFYRSLVAGGDRFKPIICPERELTRQEVAALLVDWAEDNPMHMEELPVEGIVRAAVAAYPCSADTPSN